MKATYKWMDNWAKIPDSATGRANGRTHGVCVTRSGNVIVFHQAENGLLTYDPTGRLMTATGGSRWLGAHGLTKVVEGGVEYLWLADQSSKEVAKVTLQGETVQTIARPPHAAYAQDGKYTPTWAASNPVTGDIWVADGYGSSLVHRHTAKGEYVSTLDGTEGAGRFKCPHGVNFTLGPSGPELWITDRGNRRVVVYDGNGKFQRQTTATHSPCCFDFLGDLVVIPELMTGVKIFNARTLDLVGEVGASDVVTADKQPAGWPNLAGTPLVKPGMFSSPHGGCFAPNGDIYCVEWIVGGRITKLQRQG
ncbi:MAG: hypothetical protein K8T26_00085 [Lentisphaerae bacterium]|nr:hypothetical protein [Lentisphaerota bacterium]